MAHFPYQHAIVRIIFETEKYDEAGILKIKESY